jgi:hypothetical protein
MTNPPGSGANPGVTCVAGRIGLRFRNLPPRRPRKWARSSSGWPKVYGPEFFSELKFQAVRVIWVEQRGEGPTQGEREFCPHLGLNDARRIRSAGLLNRERRPPSMYERAAAAEGWRWHASREETAS